MADLCKCEGVEWANGGVRICDRKDKCYRHTVESSEFRQSWFVGIPLKFVDGEQQCDEFWPNGK